VATIAAGNKKVGRTGAGLLAVVESDEQVDEKIGAHHDPIGECEFHRDKVLPVFLTLH
jgi:hypothetical protein